MSRQGVFWLASFAGGLYLVIGPWYVGLLLAIWALWQSRYLNRLGIWLALLAGLGFGSYTRQQTLIPKPPAGQILVMPTQWQLTGSLMTYRGQAANGVNMSGSATVKPQQAALLDRLDQPLLIDWQAPAQHVSGARNLYEFDFAVYAWRQYRIAFEAKRQALRMQVLPARGVKAKLYQVRARLLTRLNQLPQIVSRYAKGLLLGQLDADFDAVRQDFVDLGIFHLFSVSGLHLYALIGAIIWLTDRLKIPFEVMDWLLILTLPALLILIPAGAGIWRAVWMRLAQGLNRRLHLQLTALDCLALVIAGNLLIQPYVLHLFGGQLTYLLTGLIILLPKLSGFKLGLALTVCSLPVILMQTFRFHLLTALFNWLLVPVFEVGILPLMLLVTILPLPPLVGFASWSLTLLEQVLHLLANLPGLIVFGRVSAPLASLGVLVCIYCWVRQKWHLALFWLMAAWLLANVHPQARVVMFDVGQGDAILVELPFKQGTMLIDTGGRGFGFSRNPPAKRAILNYLYARGISHLDVLLLTHADADHVGDAAVITQAMPVRRLVTTPLAAEHPYIVKAKAGRVAQHVQLMAGASLKLGRLEFLVAAPAALQAEKNADSLVLYGKIGDGNWLFTGDADQKVETKTLQPLLLAVDYLKVGHHGSRTATNPAWLQEIKPQLALISAGVSNRYGHPHLETLATLNQQQVPYLVTAETGMIWIDLTAGSHQINTFLRLPQR